MLGRYFNMDSSQALSGGLDRTRQDHPRLEDGVTFSEPSATPHSTNHCGHSLSFQIIFLNHHCIQSLQEERTTAIGKQPMFPGFNDIYFSDKADNFEDGRIKTDDPDPLDQMTLRNQVQLSTYANCIGKNLKDLTNFMNEHLRGKAHLEDQSLQIRDSKMLLAAYLVQTAKRSAWVGSQGRDALRASYDLGYQSGHYQNCVRVPAEKSPGPNYDQFLSWERPYELRNILP